MNIPKSSAHFATTLASKISAADVSMSLVSATDKAGNALSGLYGFVVDRGSAAEEFMLGTVSGTTVTILTRGLDPGDGKTQQASLQQAHRRGAPVEITDYPVLAILARILNGDETFPNKLAYASHPSISAAQDIPDKQYVDAAATGHSTYDQNIVAGTAGETLAAGNIVYLKSSDARWYKATQGTVSTCIGVRLGIAQGAATVGVAVNVLIGGRDATQVGLTPGADYYLGTAGAVSTTAGTTNEVFLGRADSTTTLIFDPEFSKAFLGNNVDIPLGSGNKNVTQTGLQKMAESYAQSAGSSTNSIVGNPTITIASPAVITLNSHGLNAGDAVQFTTTGALPTGITASTTYYVLATGLTANSFQIAATPGGAAINTSGTQSGTHTASRPANNFTLTLSPAPISYAAGMEINFLANFAVTGAAMINVNGLGSINIKRLDGATALVANDIKSGQMVKLKHDGTNFQMISPSATVASASKAVIKFADGFAQSSGPALTNFIGTQNTAASGNEANIQFPIPAAGTIKNLFIRTNSAQGAGGSSVFTLRKNGVDQAVVATIGAGAAAGTFSDTINSFTVAQGDLISLKVLNNSSSAGPGISGIMAEFDPS